MTSRRGAGQGAGEQRGVPVSKERARRRDQRAAAPQRARRAAERRRADDVTRRRRGGALACGLRPRALARGLRRRLGRGPRRVDSALRRARARRWAPVAAILLVLNVVGWAVWTSVTGRVLVGVVTLALLPLIAVWVTDAARRGPGRYRRRL